MQATGLENGVLHLYFYESAFLGRAAGIDLRSGLFFSTAIIPVLFLRGGFRLSYVILHILW